ncbi:MAG: hypothetical protein ABIV50_04300 [Opitutus sp.]
MIPFFLKYGIAVAIGFYGLFLFPRSLEKLATSGKINRDQAGRARRVAMIGSCILLALTAVRFFLATR